MIHLKYQIISTQQKYICTGRYNNMIVFNSYYIGIILKKILYLCLVRLTIMKYINK